MEVTSLITYPIKSSTGIYHDKIGVLDTGLEFDRNWVVIDDDNVAITGRQNGQMLGFRSSIESNHIVVSHGSDTIRIPLDADSSRTQNIQIFSSTGYGKEISNEINDWFSHKLNQKSRLVVFDPDSKRHIQEKHGGLQGEVVKFADMNPILLISEASLDDLNSRLDRPVSMRNFRPNITVKGCAAFEEDTWKRVKIGACTFRVPQQCERCIFTTIDPDSFEKDKRGEPLRTMATYRKTESGGVAFGMHLIPERNGRLQVGDILEVLE